MSDVFVFIFIHNVVELIDDYTYRLMVSLFVYADISPRPPSDYQRRVVAIVEVVVLAGNPRRQRWKLDTIMPHLERLAEGISDDG